MNYQPGLVGITEAGMALYRHILRSPAATLREHAEAMGWALRRVQRTFRALERLGLVTEATDGKVRVDDPRATVGRLLDGEEAELDERRRRLTEQRATLEMLGEDYRRGLQTAGPRAPIFEHVGPAEAPGMVDHLLRTSTGPLIQVTRNVTSGPAHAETVRRQREAVVAAGRPMRTIFPLSMLEDSRWFAYAEERAALGEAQRYLPTDDLSVEFAVFGHSSLLLDEGDNSESAFLLLRDQGVIDVFIVLFEELWRRAQPALTQDPGARDVRLLELLALGFKDEAIARQMRLGLRTVRRRISALMAEHGVDTRFQLGLVAGQRGLVGNGRR